MNKMESANVETLLYTETQIYPAQKSAPLLLIIIIFRINFVNTITKKHNIFPQITAFFQTILNHIVRHYTPHLQKFLMVV